MKISLLILFVLLTNSVCFADGVGLGASVGAQDRIALGDYNIFDHNHLSYGAYRYGSGVSRMSLGNGFGVSLSSINGGFILGELPSDHFFLGIEPFSGKIQYDTNKETYYQWVPMLSVGPKAGPVMLAIRFGESFGSQGYGNAYPRANLAIGASGYYSTKSLKLGIEETYTGNSDMLSAFDVQTGQFGIRLERDKGLQEDTSLLFLWRIVK